ncbi:MAG: hypothetical protein K6L74_15095 [Neptuniibacter sp.]
MSKKRNPDWIADLIIDDIMSLSESELDQELIENGFHPNKDANKLHKSIQTTCVEFRKQKFLNVKAQLNKKKVLATSNADSFIESLTASGNSAKDFLIELIASGKAPSGLTVAFREGKDITESEAVSILKDFKELGYIKDDDEISRR